MKSFQEMLKELKVTTTSPDGQIKSRLIGGKELSIAFRPGSYEKYRESVLQDQFAGLARLTWVGYRRGYMKALNLSRGLAEDELERPHWDVKYRRYHEDVAVVVAQGESPSGAVRARSKGLASWKIKIEPGTIDSMSEETFISEALAAFGELRRDNDQKIVLLKDEHFGLNIPSFLREKYQTR
ncbi:MAG TPA: hypothetical protein H9902_15095 [Candidatus Stackebrandtia faecavium]|nr:hypothetical protein [Candidatus Stackebrandtia faecavium]